MRDSGKPMAIPPGKTTYQAVKRLAIVINGWHSSGWVVVVLNLQKQYIPFDSWPSAKISWVILLLGSPRHLAQWRYVFTVSRGYDYPSATPLLSTMVASRKHVNLTSPKSWKVVLTRSKHFRCKSTFGWWYVKQNGNRPGGTTPLENCIL